MNLEETFFKLLNSFEYEDKKLISEEIMKVFDSELGKLKRMSFYLLNPVQAL